MAVLSDRIILHCDLNNFYASVECLQRPELRDVPMAVSGDPEKRHGIILAKNEKAKKLGVKTAETIWQARLKCPGLVLVPPRHELYMRFSEQVFDLYTRFTPLVEPFGPDESWLDVTGCTRLWGDGKTIADKIRETVKAETGLTVSAGVSFNKIFAKIGSDLRKPDATTVISRENFRTLVWPLPAGDMPGVGKKTAEKLEKLNIRTIGETANADPALLRRIFGVNGERMVRDARGENDDGVREATKEREAESVGHGMTAIRDLCTYEDAEAVVYYLADRVGARMRKKGFRASGVAVNLRDKNLVHTTRQKTLPAPTCAAADIARAAIELLHANWPCSPPLRTVTVSAFDLVRGQAPMQTSMFGDEKPEKAEKLEKALDAIKEKYGPGVITRGNLIGRDFIYDKTDSEDFLPFKR